MNILEVTFCREKEYGKRSDKGIHLLKPDQRALDDALEKINREGGAWDAVFIYCDQWADLKAWRRPDSYMGPQYWGYVGICGQSRDSGVLARCNFECIKDDAESRLGKKEPYNWLDEEMPVLETAGASHWAVGWVETFMVYWADADALDFAAEVKEALEHYPVYDDSAYSEMEWDEAQETFKNNSDSFCSAIAWFLTGDNDTDAFEPKALETVAAILFQADCGYSGYDQAWVDKSDVAKLTKEARWELTQAARDGNKVARQLMRKAKVAFSPKPRRIKGVAHA